MDNLPKSIDSYWRLSPEEQAKFDQERKQRTARFRKISNEEYKLISENAMKKIDALPSALREVVHAKGWRSVSGKINKYGVVGALAFYQLEELGLS